uniref:Orphan G-protein coupled receptor 49 n=1 Tax=Platynereis dumerilii TaxID=6359 RepID=A0A0K0PUJ9_PLADU|nr:orphan G-protein coupled receptor 49 [Platynereis dumerilii]
MADPEVYADLGGIPYNVSLDNTSGAPTPGSTQESEWYGLAKTLWIYVAPFIFVVGVIGNVLILIVMMRRKFQGTTTCIYLRLMALADLLVLIIGMVPEWLSANDIVIFKEVHPVTCKLEKFLQYTTGDVSIWILMCFTVDRFIAVCFPFSKTNFCKPGRARFYGFIVLLAAIFKNLCVFWTRGPVYHSSEGDNSSLVLVSNCGRPQPFTYFEKLIRPWIVFALISVLPFLVIVICNVMIIRALIESRVVTSGNKIQSNMEKTYMQMTLMCLSASFAFLVFITPSIVLLIGKPYWDNDSDSYIIAKAVNNQLTYVNHSINFFLYCLSGARFRKELVRTLICCVGHQPTTSSAWETTDGGNTLNRYRMGSSRNSTPISNRKGGSPRNGSMYRKLDLVQSLQPSNKGSIAVVNHTESTA